MSDEKRVDESWKEQVERERAASQQEPVREERTNLGQFLSSLSMQAMVALGELPHPATGKPQQELDQARYLIDILGTLQEKTQGNLTPQEAELLEGLLYELRMKYAAKVKR